MNYTHEKRRGHNDLRAGLRPAATQRLAPFQEGDYQLTMAYVKGMSDSGSFWFLLTIFSGGLFWGGLLTSWLS